MKKPILILIKCVERDITVKGLFTNEQDAKKALAKDFIVSITQDYALDDKEVDEAKKLVLDKLKNLNTKSESILKCDNYGTCYEIDLDAGTAWFNGHDCDYDWKIINLEKI